RERPVVRRGAQAVDEDLPAIEWGETGGRGVAQPDHAQEPIIGWIGDRDGVGELLGSVDAVTVADRDVLVGRLAGRLARHRRRAQQGAGEQGAKEGVGLHRRDSSFTSLWWWVGGADGWVGAGAEG